MSLVEILIAVAILAAVLILALSLMLTTGEAYEKNAITQDLEYRGHQMVDFCRRDFKYALFTGSSITVGSRTFSMGIYSDYTQIRYRVPTGSDTDGENLWGYTSPLPDPNSGLLDDLACFIRFEAEEGFRESAAALTPTQQSGWGSSFPSLPALEVTIVGNDLNEDGDQEDAFVRGKIVRYIVAPSTHAATRANDSNPVLDYEVLCDKVILRCYPNYNATNDYDGDMDGDGAGMERDRLFAFVDADGRRVTTTNVVADGAGVLITVWTAALDTDRETYRLRKSRVGIAFGNTQ